METTTKIIYKVNDTNNKFEQENIKNCLRNACVFDFFK